MITVSGGGAFGASAQQKRNSPGVDERELGGARELGRRVADAAGQSSAGSNLHCQRTWIVR